ncbi:MAG: hypothetical protein KBD23_00300 [Gammaproteobacteria bacterium]|nr:hypothetical protein [Gammaproteobacteria bacterium]MBP9728571.1 hypothetical protein [Gammaproteobacteria bacterium]
MKNHLKTTLNTFLSLLLLLSFSSATLSEPSTRKVNHKNINYLFVQSAPKLQLEQDKEKPNVYRIILKDVNPDVTYFTERPYRKTYTMPTVEFIQLWEKKNKNSFLYNPPNAAVVATQKSFFSKDTLLNVVMELTAPYYDEQAKTLSYTAKLLEGNMSPHTHSVTFEQAFLFIDDVCLSCWFP